MKAYLAERVLSSMRCGVVTVDRHGTVTTLNEQACRYLRVRFPVPEGTACRELFAHCPAVAHLLLDALDRKTLPDRAELELVLDGERQVLIGFSLSQITNAKGAVVGSAIFFKDLTLVEQEREREALRNRLASLGEVAAQLAHEVRNRLGGIRLFLGLARRRLEGDDEGCAYLDRAEGEVLAANGKMGEILDYVRPLNLDRVPTAVGELLREALESTLARFPDAEVAVTWALAPELPLIPVDPERLRDAFANLFANAVEAMGDRGTLHVAACMEESSVLVDAPGKVDIPGLRGYGESLSPRLRVDVFDSGPGMPPEVLRRVFQPFYTTKDHGSGLGISSAQKVFDAHTGSLDLRSVPGEGTHFTVRLPVAEEIVSA
ncbi:MAG TPA: ATP-binding protein [Deferrisomatales bacterium]|nr:ATP-binding protein [Deferrisomatales bacterium]